MTLQETAAPPVSWTGRTLPEIIPCSACGEPLQLCRRRCAACGFSQDELRRWRNRNLTAWRTCLADLTWRTWEVAVLLVLLPVPFLCIWSVTSQLGGADARSVLPALRAIDRFSQTTITILGLLVATRIDLALRRLPPWAHPGGSTTMGARSWFGRWWPGAMLLVAADGNLRYFLQYRFDGWFVVVWGCELLLSAAAVGAAVSLAFAAGRMDRWCAVIAPSVARCEHRPRASDSGMVRRVFASWAAVAMVLMAYPLAMIGSPQFNSVWTVGNPVVKAIVWSAGIVWLWNLLAVQRSLRRLVNG